MALSDKLASTPQRINGKPCSVGALEDYLSGAEADAFNAMLHTLGWSARRVYDAVQQEAADLEKRGDFEAAAVHLRLAEQTINRHRSRGCRCFKSAA